MNLCWKYVLHRVVQNNIKIGFIVSKIEFNEKVFFMPLNFCLHEQFFSLCFLLFKNKMKFKTQNFQSIILYILQCCTYALKSESKKIDSRFQTGALVVKLSCDIRQFGQNTNLFFSNVGRYSHTDIRGD